MPSFADRLSDKEIKSLVDLIYTPLKQTPEWNLSHINHTREIFFQPSELSDTPVFTADMMNLFIVVELGDHHATLLDGDKFEPIQIHKHHG